MDGGSLRLWHRMLLLGIAFSLILSYPPLLRYFREAVLAIYNPRTREQPVNLFNTILCQFVQIEDTMMPVVINHFFQIDTSCV